MGAEALRKAEDLAGTDRCGDRPADRRHHVDLDDRPRPGSALRHSAATDRRHALRCLRSAPGHAVLHPGQQLSRDHGGSAGAAEFSVERSITSISSRRAPGSRCRCARWSNGPQRRPHSCRSTIRASLPSVTLSFNLRAGCRAEPGRRGDPEGRSRTRRAGVADGLVSGQRPGVPVIAFDASLISSPPRSSSSISSSACSTRATSIR